MKTRRQIAEAWADFQESTDPRCVGATVKAVAGELRALWAREKLLEAVVREARSNEVWLRCGCDMCVELRRLDAYDKENPR